MLSLFQIIRPKYWYGFGKVLNLINAPLSLGKSLDKIAELREKNKLPKPGKKKRRNAQAKVKNIKLSNEVQASNAL